MRAMQNPGGDTSSDRVAHANAQTKNFILLCILAHLRGVFYTVENPGSTLMFRWGPMMQMNEWSSANKVRTYMGNFGGDTAKPMDLVSTFPYIGALAGKKPPPTQNSLVTRSKNGTAITGKGAELTASAAYTLPFGKAYANAFCQYHKDVKANAVDAGKYQAVKKAPTKTTPKNHANKPFVQDSSTYVDVNTGARIVTPDSAQGGRAPRNEQLRRSKSTTFLKRKGSWFVLTRQA
eukprot:15097199-Alexandrium_andersonii.AAC.1